MTLVLTEAEARRIKNKQATYIPVRLVTQLDAIENPPLCWACNTSTKKAFVPFSLISTDQTIVIGTKNLAGYECPKDQSIFLSHVGSAEFDTAAAKIFETQGLLFDAQIFQKAAERHRASTS